MRKILISMAVVGVLALVPALAIADTPTTGSGGFPTVGSGGAPTIGSGGQPAGQYSIQNPLKVTSICGLIKALLDGAIAIGTPIAVLFIIWSGFKFVFAQGNPKALGKARSNFFYTVIGIAVFLGAWLLVQIVVATINAIGGSNILVCV